MKTPQLNKGEVLVGLLSDKDMQPYWCILLPGDNDDATHEAQLEWAKSIGGDLPTRTEQAMLWANCRDQLQKDRYWSNEIHHAEPGWAWCQYFDYENFDYGSQLTSHRITELRARAVRRINTATL